MEERIKQLKALIDKSERIVFFGGAGTSTESGVKDYRSEDGLYNTVKEYGVSPEVILSHTFLFEKPEVFYDFYYKYFLAEDVFPNKAHKALARLEEMGKLSCVITQNIDGLHQAAGSKNVLELHGTTYEHYCSVCRQPYEREKLKALCGGVPKCEKCGALVRPKVVLYEESLYEKTVMAAVNALSDADLLIIGGTSLAVYPAASYIGYYGGKDIVLINRGETRYDHMATLVFREKIGEVLDEVVNE